MASSVCPALNQIRQRKTRGLSTNGDLPGWAKLLPAHLPIGDSLERSAVAAGQPEGAVRQDVGAVGDPEDQEVAPRGLQQGLQASFQAAPGAKGKGEENGHHIQQHNGLASGLHHARAQDFPARIVRVAGWF